MGDGAEGDDSWFATSGNRVEQESGEGEVTEHVGSEVELEPIDCVLTASEVLGAGIVDEKVDRSEVCCNFRGEDPHRSERGDVEGADLESCSRNLRTNTVGCVFAGRGLTDGQDHLGAVSREFGGGDESEPGVRAGYDRGSSGLVGNLCCCPMGHGHRRYERNA